MAWPTKEQRIKQMENTPNGKNNEDAQKGREVRREGLLKLNVGCGPQHKEGYVNIDRLSSADVQTDLELATLPFEDESVSEILADQVLEHITNLIPLMNEFHRVLSSGGRLKIEVPHVPYTEAFQDPTHVRFFTDQSFNYWHEYDYLWAGVGSTYGIQPFQHLNISKQGWILKVTLVKA